MVEFKRNYVTNIPDMNEKVCDTTFTFKCGYIYECKWITLSGCKYLNIWNKDKTVNIVLNMYDCKKYLKGYGDE